MQISGDYGDYFACGCIIYVYLGVRESQIIGLAKSSARTIKTYIYFFRERERAEVNFSSITLCRNSIFFMT